MAVNFKPKSQVVGVISKIQRYIIPELEVRTYIPLSLVRNQVHKLEFLYQLATWLVPWLSLQSGAPLPLAKIILPKFVHPLNDLLTL